MPCPDAVNDGVGDDGAEDIAYDHWRSAQIVESMISKAS